MVTSYPHRIAPSHDEEAVDARPADDGIGTRVLGRVRQAFCGLHGHDNLLQFEPDRLFLKCVSCGHETPGWEISEPPRVAEDIRQATHRGEVRSAPLIGVRRIA